MCNAVTILVRPRIYYIIIMYTTYFIEFKITSLQLYVINYYDNITEPQGNLILFNEQKNSHVSKNEESYYLRWAVLYTYIYS